MADEPKNKHPVPDVESEYKRIHHMRLMVGNAKQAADWYIGRMGFRRVAYKGLETGERNIVSHIVRAGGITLELSSALQPGNKAFSEFLERHGDAVVDVAFEVTNCRAMFEFVKSRGARVVREPEELKDEKFEGSMVVATVRTYGDTVHTFIEDRGFTGPFLPSYAPYSKPDPFYDLTDPIDYNFIDHVVGNQPDNQMLSAVQEYEKVFGFSRFWSVDDSQIHTEYSALRSIVMTDWYERVKMPINEPANGKKKSQIQEYVEFNHGAGVQHAAFNVSEIIPVISNLRKRGLEFLHVPDTYYEALREKLKSAPIDVKEDLDKLQELNILIDYDDKGYLLQLFTKPVEDRPTLFIEIIQRNNHEGFGIGNFKALFQSIEAEQALRGNLEN